MAPTPTRTNEAPKTQGGFCYRALVAASVWHALQAVSGLRKGESARVKETEGVKAVPWVDVEAVIAQVNRMVGAMIQLQWLTGMRPGEVCAIRRRDVDRSDGIWVYRPEQHKTEHHGQSCERLLGPRAQRVLEPFLKVDSVALLFSPMQAETDRQFGRREARVLPLWPSHKRRLREDSCGRAGERYTTHSYRRAVQRACARAGVQVWSPNQLRHSRATEITERYGLEAAQVSLGHASADITQVYAERDQELARRVALETG